MKIKTLLFILLSYFSSLAAYSQNEEFEDIFQLDAVEVSSIKLTTEATTLPSVNIPQAEINLHMGHNLMDALSHKEGVQAMDIGVGFSKPMIRGLGFQRVAVIENGIKQEGQQWGADHGLEIDVFHVADVRVVKGPSSVLYGSDALGGAIELLPTPFPKKDTIFGECLFQHQSACSGFSGSGMFAIKRKNIFSQFRYTERHWGDYSVPADSFTYLSMRLPISNRHLINTAGKERSVNGMFAYKGKRYEGRLNLSDNYQKSGFFSGAHGIPSTTSLQDDGSKYDISLPYSIVNHLKVISSNKWKTSTTQTTFNIAYQNNHREEWSKFHTHNVGQVAPQIDPDKELMLNLQTLSAKLQFSLYYSNQWEHYIGISSSLQKNEIGGYGFLIPAFNRNEFGSYYLVNFKINALWLLNASLRYDIAHIHTQAHGLEVEKVRNDYHDYSLAIGVDYTPQKGSEWKASIGRAYRLPSANELTSNGVHHGAFRHELGDKDLKGEQGWQADLSYTLQKGRFDISISPFFSYYPHFITLHPTGQWSELPDAGQIYQFNDSPAAMYGGEARLKVALLKSLYYEFSGEYVRSNDLESHTSTPFSPPASMRNTLSWESNRWQAFVECHSVATQKHVCHNEEETPGYNLFNVGGMVDFTVFTKKLSILAKASNLFNTFYLNHLNFYRKIELPEAGFDFQTTIRLTF